jgi:hypothetical protein
MLWQRGFESKYLMTNKYLCQLIFEKQFPAIAEEIIKEKSLGVHLKVLEFKNFSSCLDEAMKKKKVEKAWIERVEGKFPLYNYT